MVPSLGVSVSELPMSLVDTDRKTLKLLMEKTACPWALGGGLAS